MIKPGTGAGALRTNIIRSPEEYARALKLFSGQSDVEKGFERNFLFDEIQYLPDAPAGPYGRVGQAIVSDPDEGVRLAGDGQAMIRTAGRPARRVSGPARS